MTVAGLLDPATVTLPELVKGQDIGRAGVTLEKGNSVIKRIGLLVTAALLVATMAMGSVAPSAFAQSAGERECEADPNAEWTRVGPGQYECVTTTVEEGPINPGQGNKPKDIEEETTEPQQGQGVGGGAKDEPTELNCVYNQNGNLQQSKSDEGCPAEDPTP
jgi:hypothetical protein